MSRTTYKYPLSIQTVLPEDYKNDLSLRKELAVLNELAFTGVELNIAHPEKVNFEEIRDFLGEFNLQFTMFASGLTAKTFNLSLSSGDVNVRNEAVKKVNEIIDYLGNTDTGIILGFFKGSAVTSSNIEETRNYFKDSIRKIAAVAEKRKVRILIEATNRYESSVANSLADTVELLNEFDDNKCLEILPDTFHMNIEESDMFGALKKHKNKYASIHISDNNRFFPGFGAINFKEVIKFLTSIGYQGGLAIEGNVCNSFISDVRRSVETLKKADI